jgi:hypothetical protein
MLHEISEDEEARLVYASTDEEPELPPLAGSNIITAGRVGGNRFLSCLVLSCLC